MRKKGNSKKGGCLILVFGTLCVIVGLFLFIFLTGQLTGALVQSLHGGKVAYAMLNFYEAAIIICFILLEAILFIKCIPNEEDYKKKRGIGYTDVEEKKRKIPVKTLLRIIICGILAVVVLLPFISANTYILVSEDGIKTHFFVDTKEYSWDEVSAYTVNCDSSKGLSVSFTMNDGKIYEVLHGPKSATAEFDGKYTDVLEFLVDIDAKLKLNENINKNVTHMETAVAFYKNDNDGLWEYVSILTGYSEIYPEGDELPVTQTTTESVTESVTQ